MEGHVFILIDRAEFSNINCPRSWGKNAVIIDAWAGKVYPAADIYTLLKTHKAYADTEEHFNVNVSYNARKHQLAHRQ